MIVKLLTDLIVFFTDWAKVGGISLRKLGDVLRSLIETFGVHPLFTGAITFEHQTSLVIRTLTQAVVFFWLSRVIFVRCHFVVDTGGGTLRIILNNYGAVASDIFFMDEVPLFILAIHVGIDVNAVIFWRLRSFAIGKLDWIHLGHVNCELRFCIDSGSDGLSQRLPVGPIDQCLHFLASVQHDMLRVLKPISSTKRKNTY